MYKSDKYFHNYHNVYEHFLHKFKKKKLKILEIGVSDGSSIKAWSEYFKSSLIIGIDIKKIDIKKRKLKKKISMFSKDLSPILNLLIR